MPDASWFATLLRAQRRARDFHFWSQFTGALPLALLGAFVWRTWRRGRAPLPGGPRPAATVIVPCKKALPLAEPIVRALLHQEYDGETEYLFVTATRECPAHPTLERILRAIGDPRARLLVSDAKPSVCGEKVLNQLHAVEHASPGSELLVFADEDVCVDRRWLAALVAPLGDPGVGASTTGFLECGGANAMVRAVQCMSLGCFYPFAAIHPILFGPSFAMRRKDFNRLGIASIWSRRVSEEIPLPPFLKGRGLRVEFASEAIVASHDPTDLAGSVAAFSRWLFFVRLYDPFVWRLFFGALALKTYIVGEMIFRGAWAHLAYVAACDLLYGLLAGVYYNRVHLARLQGRFGGFRVSPLCAAMAWPLLHALYWAAFLRSMGTRSVRWAGYEYIHLGPDDVKAVAVPTP